MFEVAAREFGYGCRWSGSAELRWWCEVLALVCHVAVLG